MQTSMQAGQKSILQYFFRIGTLHKQLFPIYNEKQ